jgi:phospholipid/cholesterol/gamma-HCH transport system substrate-binding protein
MSTEAKVGIFTLTAFILFMFIAAELAGFSLGGNKSYAVNVMFHDVTGLRRGNAVKYAGVDVGRIENIAAGEVGATVKLIIDKDIEIPRNALITIGSDGIMGEKFIAVMPPKDSYEGKLSDGDTVYGRDEQGLEQLILSANGVLEDIHALVNSMNKMFGDERLQKSVIESAENIREMTANMNQLTAVLSRLAVNNEADIKSMIENFRQVGENMNRMTARIDAMLTEVDNDGQTARDLREALSNLNMTSRRIENMAKSMEGVITDPEVADDLKAALHSVRSASSKADKMLSQVSNIKVESGVDVMYSGGLDEYKVNTDTKINFNDREFLQLGINDLGEENYKNIQLGSWNGSFGGRAGLIDDKAGVGIDKAMGKFNMSLDAYNPNDFQLKLRAAYKVAPETYIIGETDNLNRSERRETFVGLRRAF